MDLFPHRSSPALVNSNSGTERAKNQPGAVFVGPQLMFVFPRLLLLFKHIKVCC